MSDQSSRYYTIGLDYGSLSCRGVITDVHNGTIVAEKAAIYPHGVMDAVLPDGTPLGDGWQLQDPCDFEQVLIEIVQGLLNACSVLPEQIIGIGIDFTASTVIPVDEEFCPLSVRFANRPHAWAKMWKHHAATHQAIRLTQICQMRNEEYLNWYGGKISPECLLAKVLQVFEEDRFIFDATYAFVEAADYITSLLVGSPVLSTALASAKAFYSPDHGYPSEDFFAAYHPLLCKLPKTKLMGHFPNCIACRPGARAGGLSREMAEKLGLLAGTTVTAGHMDAYTPMLGLGITRPGTVLMIIGTSTGIMAMDRECRPINGLTACVKDIYYPGLWGYAAGQASVGDAFQWFVEQCVPARDFRAAELEGKSIQEYLTDRASALAPGEAGLLALDWLNGNRSCIGNSRLSGMFLGLTLSTQSEEMYRALLEATAFGARCIVEAYKRGGAAVDEIWICGGIAGKNSLMMQIYADVLGMPLHVSRCRQAPALGAAVYAAAASEKSGYADIFQAANTMGCTDYILYTPNPSSQAIYEEMYQEYCTLCDYFGRGGNLVMERMFARKHACRQNSGNREQSS